MVDRPQGHTATLLPDGTVLITGGYIDAYGTARGAGRKLMAVSVKTGEKFAAGAPKALFDTRISPYRLSLYRYSRFDVSKDGRFLIPTFTEQAPDSPLTLIVNWPALLKK